MDYMTMCNLNGSLIVPHKHNSAVPLISAELYSSFEHQMTDRQKEWWADEHQNNFGPTDLPIFPRGSTKWSQMTKTGFIAVYVMELEWMNNENRI